MSNYKPWTTRNVRFEVFPRGTSQIEPLMDALVDHYWERREFLRRFVEPGISSSGRVVEVSGLPWWMPAWWARRVVTDIAHRLPVGGSATFLIERTTLIEEEAS